MSTATSRKKACTAGATTDRLRRLLGPPCLPAREMQTAADAERMVRALGSRCAFRLAFRRRRSAPPRLLRLWWGAAAAAAAAGKERKGGSTNGSTGGSTNRSTGGVPAARRARLSRGAAPALHPATDLEWLLAADDVRGLEIWLMAESARPRRVRRFPHAGDWVAAPAPPMPGDRSLLWDADAARYRRYDAAPYRLARQLLLLAAAAGAPRVCAFIQQTAQRALPPSSLRFGQFAPRCVAARAFWAATEDAALTAACDAGRGQSARALVQASPRMSARVASGAAFDVDVDDDDDADGGGGGNDQDDDDGGDDDEGTAAAAHGAHGDDDGGDDSGVMRRAAARLPYASAFRRFRPELWAWLNQASGGKFATRIWMFTQDSWMPSALFAGMLLPARQIPSAQTRARLEWWYSRFPRQEFDATWPTLFARAVSTSNLGALRWLAEQRVATRAAPRDYAAFAAPAIALATAAAPGLRALVGLPRRSDATRTPISPWEHALAVLERFWPDEATDGSGDDDDEAAAAAAAGRLLQARSAAAAAAAAAARHEDDGWAAFWAARRVVQWMRERAPPGLREWLGTAARGEESLRMAVVRPAMFRALAALCAPPPPPPPPSHGGGAWRAASGAGLLTLAVRWARSSAHLAAMMRALLAAGVEFEQHEPTDMAVFGTVRVPLCPWTAATQNPRLDLTALQMLAGEVLVVGGAAGEAAGEAAGGGRRPLLCSRAHSKKLMMRALAGRWTDPAMLDWTVVALASAVESASSVNDDADSNNSDADADDDDGGADFSSSSSGDADDAAGRAARYLVAQWSESRHAMTTRRQATVPTEEALDALQTAARAGQSTAVLEWVWRRFAPGVPLSEVPLCIAFCGGRWTGSVDVAIGRLRWLLAHGARRYGTVERNEDTDRGMDSDSEERRRVLFAPPTARPPRSRLVVCMSSDAGGYVLDRLLFNYRVSNFLCIWPHRAEVRAHDRAVSAWLERALLPLSVAQMTQVLPVALESGCVRTAAALWARCIGATTTREEGEAVARATVVSFAKRVWPLTSIQLMFGPTQSTATPTFSAASSGWRARLPWSSALYRQWIDNAAFRRWALRLLLRRGSKQQLDQAVTLVRQHQNDRDRSWVNRATTAAEAAMLAQLVAAAAAAAAARVAEEE